MEDIEKESTRRPKIDKDELLGLLNKIGILTLPKCHLIRKTKVKPKKTINKQYLTHGRSVDNKMVEVLDDKYRSAYCLPPELSVLNDRPRRRGLYKSLHTYRSRLNVHKLERLFVPEGEKLPGKSITEDIDPEYYTIVAGRPIKELENLDEHKWAVRSYFLTRLQMGWLHEEQTKIDQKQKYDEQLIKNFNNELKKQVEGFSRFLEEDYKISADLLLQAENAAAVSQQQEDELAVLSKELESTKTRVSLLKEEWADCQMLQQFLYSVAPLPWRRLHDYIHKKVTTLDVEGPMFGRSRIPSLTIKNEMSSKLAKFIGDTRSCETPALYFDDPEQLFSMFQDLQERNLSALLECEKIQPAVLTMKKADEEAENTFNKERTALEEDVEDLRKEVELEEAKAKKLEEETQQIIQEHLHALLTDNKSIRLFSCVEDAFTPPTYYLLNLIWEDWDMDSFVSRNLNKDFLKEEIEGADPISEGIELYNTRFNKRTYERAVGPNDRNLGAVEMMRALETTHERLRLQLDILPAQLVNRITNSWEREERRIMREAKDAAKKVHQMDMLVKKFSKALKPWTPFPTRRLVSRSEPPPEKIKKTKPPQPLTSAEQDEQYFLGTKTDGDPYKMYRPLC